MYFKFILLFCVFCLNYAVAKSQTYEKDLPILFKQCAQTRIDSAHRLIVGFMRKHEVSFLRRQEIIPTPERFAKFYGDY